MLGGLLLDLLIVITLAVSVVAGVSRGGLREIIALAGWALAAVIGMIWFEPLSVWLDGLFAEPGVGPWAAVLLILVLAAATISLVDVLLHLLLRRHDRQARDPLLGLAVGLTRGLLLVLVAVGLAHQTSLPERQVWMNSQLLSHVEALVLELRPRLPDAVASLLIPRQERQGGRRVVLPKDSRGHYVGQAQVNGVVVDLLVDTGATVMMIPAHLADRLGRLRPGESFNAKTVTGEVTARSTTINDLRIGPILLRDVEASLVPSPHDTVLLGMSVLNRLSFIQVPDGLVLEQGGPVEALGAF